MVSRRPPAPPWPSTYDGDGNRVLLLAHRGAPVDPRLENTVPALHAALAGGADGAEVDLRLSRDGVLVLSHDPDLLRVTGAALPVATTDWAALDDAAARAGLPLARLEQVLVAVDGRPIVLELKAPPPVPGAVQRTVDVLLARLRALRDDGLPLDVTVSSFVPAMVGVVRAGASAAGVPETRTALLGRPAVRPAALLRQALAAGHDQVHPHVGSVLADPGNVHRASACGVAVVPWTVNRDGAVRRLAGLGVHAVITDVPVTARAALNGRRLPA